MTTWLRMADVEYEPIEWLWCPVIARRKLTIIAGEPGLGKSTFGDWIASRLSNAGTFPVGRSEAATAGECLNTFILNAEDGLRDTVKKRLDDFGADQTRIWCPDLVFKFDDAGFSDLRAACRVHQPGLIVIDPVSFFVGGQRDMHRANEAREWSHALLRIAEDFNCAILMITHLNKSRRGKMIDKILGSIDLPAAARLVYGVKGTRGQGAVMSLVKGNVLEPGDKPKDWKLERGPNDIVLSESGLSADDLLEIEEEGAEGHGGVGAFDIAVEWLRAALADGPVESSALRTDAADAGITERTLARARKALGATAIKEGGSWWTSMGAAGGGGNA